MLYSSKLRGLALLLVLSTLASAQAVAPAPARAIPLLHHPASRATDADGFFRMSLAVEDDYFDGHDSRERVRRHISVAKALGVKYLRCAFSWNGLEPERGKFQFEFWDMLVDEAAKNGIEIIPYIAYTPEWAARSPQQFWEQPPRDPQLFAAMLRTVVGHFKGRIRSWELWNEPDLAEYWQGTPDEFADLIIAGAQAVREADPQAIIILGGISKGPGAFPDVLFNQRHLDRYVDVIAMHAYPESWHEMRAEDVFHEHLAKMNAYRGTTGVDFWLNEMGYADYRYEPAHASTWGTNVYYRYEHTSRYQAEFLFKSLAMTMASGDISLAGWYRIDDFRHTDKRMPEDKVHYHLGLIDVNGRRKPAFYAMRFFSKLFAQGTRDADLRVTATAKPDSQAIVHSFERKDGTYVLTSWLRSSEYNEVSRHTGMERDTRSEQISVALPCTAATVTRYNGLGQKLSTRHPNSETLSAIRLTGDRVYVAVVKCAGK